MYSIFKSDIKDVSNNCYEVRTCSHNGHDYAYCLHNVGQVVKPEIFSKLPISTSKLSGLKYYCNDRRILFNLDAFSFIPGQESLPWGNVFAAVFVPGQYKYQHTVAVDNAGQVYVGDCGWEMANNGGGKNCSYTHVGQDGPQKIKIVTFKDGERSSNNTGVTKGGHKEIRSVYSRKFCMERATEASMRKGADSGQGMREGPVPMESLACGPKNYTLESDCTAFNMVQDTGLEEWLATLTFEKITGKTYSVIESKTVDRAMYDSYSLTGTSSVVHNLSQSRLMVVKNNSVQSCTPGVYKYFPGYFSSYRNDKFSSSDIVQKDLSFILKPVHNFSFQQEFGVMVYDQPFIDINSGARQLMAPDMYTWMVKAHKAVQKSGVPNYVHSRLLIPSGLNIYNWRRYLKGYKYKILCEYLAFGFPLNIDQNKFTFNTDINNHSSACRSLEGVDKYFATEITHKTMVGPLQVSPFERTHYSPLMTRSKPDGGVRVIVDLSWPINNSVNSAIPDDRLDILCAKLRYPTIDNLVERISILGPSARLYKVDLQRAYRNLRVDPRDYPLLGLKWRDATYYDVAIPFGLKQGALGCQFSTDTVTYLMASQRHWVMSYLDDVIGASSPDRANDAFLTLVQLLQNLGLPLNKSKVVAPVSKLTCLGIDVDAKLGILTIPPKKLREIRKLCVTWIGKEVATRNQLQKLLGKLLYINRCIKPARLFSNRMLQLLRQCPIKGCIAISKGFRKNLNWFLSFMEQLNGSVEMHTKNSYTYDIYVDASLQGLGAKLGNMVYAIPILNALKHICTIVHFEALNILVALKCWAKYLTNQKVVFWCDNSAVVNIFTNFKIRDSILMACVRNVWLLAAVYNIDLKVKHIQGVSNVYADILSRWSHYNNQNTLPVRILKTCKWLQPDLNSMIPDFNI